MEEEKIYRPGDPWEAFPPNKSDEHRIKKYERYKELYKCKHLKVFERAREWVNKKPGIEKRLYIAVNFPKLISKLIADLLFGEPLRISVPENKDLQERLREQSVNASLQASFYESALSGSYRGGAVLKAQWESGVGATIVSKPCQYYFPHFDPDDQRKLLGATIAWTREHDGKTYLRREIHTPGHVKQELWLMDGDKPKDQLPLSFLGITVPEELDTDCPTMLVEYVPNMRLDDEFWGESDYADIETEVEALNGRLSYLHRVLNVHSEPVLVGPPGLMKSTPGEREKYYNRSDENAVEVSGKEAAEVIRYVTWDAHLTATFDEIDRLLDSLMVVAEVTPDMFGMGKNGYAESARAIKFRWARQLAKRQRREMMYDPAIRRLLKCAAILDNRFGNGPKVSDKDQVNLLWGDGLPNDPKERAEEESLLLAAGITSKRSAFMRVFQAEEEDADREMAQIESEKKREFDLLLSGGSGSTDGDEGDGGGDGDGGDE